MEEKNENVVEETTQEQVEQKPVEETTQVDESKFKSAGDDSVVKVDLSKPPTPKENENKEDNADDSGVAAESENAEPTQEQKEIQPEAEAQEETTVLEEVTEDNTEEQVAEVEEKVEEAIAEAEATGKPLPENIQKLVDFMEDTGGDINDYVKLNQDYSKLDDNDVVFEYYKQTKPHLTNDEINFLMEDTFKVDEEEDTDREIKRKKLAFKEQVASARSHLDRQKSRYYEEIKAGSKLTPEQQKAWDFFNRYNKESEEQQKTLEATKSNFLKKTNQVFNDKFKGFEYNVGDKKYRFNVKDVNKVKNSQDDIGKFIGKFLDDNNQMSDAAGYHKALYTAMNADAIAKHFYEQGKADAMKTSVAKAKNVNMEPRQAHGEVNIGGMKVKVLGNNSSDFKFKIKNKR
jgi:hypothetical protein